MALEPGRMLGSYQVTALIGEGGMGQVYQATDTKLNRQVALKILPEAWKWQGENGPFGNVKRDPSVGWSSRRGRTERSDGRPRRDGCPSTRFLLSSVGRLVPLGGLEAVAVPVGRQHGRMVHDAVDDGRGGGRIQEHLGPAGERQIGRHDQAPALVAAADEAEQQVGAGLVERHVAELVNDDHVEAGEVVEFPGQPPLASATKAPPHNCRIASRSSSGCASNWKASRVLSIGKRASWRRRWMRRSRRPVTSRCTNCARYSAGGWRSRVAWAASGRHSVAIVARHKVLRSVTRCGGSGTATVIRGLPVKTS